MRKLLIIAILFASCTADYDDIGSSTTYFINVVAEVEKATYQVDDVYFNSPKDVEKYTEPIYTNPEASSFEKQKIEDSYKSGQTVIMDQFIDGGLRFIRTQKTYFVTIRIN